MAVQPGRVLAQRVQVAVPVRIPQMAALATHHVGRKRVEKQHTACIAAGQHAQRLLMKAFAGGVRTAVLLDGLVQCLVKVAHACHCAGNAAERAKRQAHFPQTGV